MAQKKLSLEAGGPQRLEVSWRGGFKDLSISLDGQSVASFEGPKELKEPQPVSLPDGSTLEVQVASVFVIPELRLTRDGEPIPGSASDPATRHTGAWGMVLAVAILNVAIGLLVELFDLTSMRAIGAGWGSLLSGLVYGVLAFFVRRKSLVALGLAVGLVILDGIFVLVAGGAGRPQPTRGQPGGPRLLPDPDGAWFRRDPRARPAPPRTEVVAGATGLRTVPTGCEPGRGCFRGRPRPPPHGRSREAPPADDRAHRHGSRSHRGRAGRHFHESPGRDRRRGERPALPRPQMRDRRGGPA